MKMDPIFDRQWDNIVVNRDGRVVTVTMKRPEAENGLNVPLIQDLWDFAHLIRRRSDVQVVILTGGDTLFCEGGVFETIMERISVPTALERRVTVIQGGDMVNAWEDIEAITVAAIEGRCRGGGCALAMALDFRIIGEGTEMFLPENPLGLSMGWGTIPRVTSLVGPARAKRFIMLGEILDAETYLAWGLADELAPKAGSLAAAYRWADRLCALPPVPMRMSKASINAYALALGNATSYTDRDQYLLTAPSEDFTEGVAALVEGRDPLFKGN